MPCLELNANVPDSRARALSGKHHLPVIAKPNEKSFAISLPRRAIQAEGRNNGPTLDAEELSVGFRIGVTGHGHVHVLISAQRLHGIRMGPP